MRKIATMSAAVMCFFVVAAGASAATYHIDPNGSADFTTIQAALNSPLNPGDVIIVAKGTYAEHVNFLGKAVTLQSADPLDPDTVANTVINATDNGTCVSFSNGEGAGSVLKGFTIRNGFAYQGGGAYCLGASPTISHCVFKDNWGNSSGGGICNMSGSHPKVANCTFIANVGEDFGGGIYNYPGCSPTITDCLFIDNSVGVWNGRDTATSGSPVIVNCTFARNMFYGILNCMSSTLVANSILWDTTPIYNGGAVPGVLYCDVKGGWGTNNINADPCFVNPSANDFRLAPGSPCIDAGANSLVPSGIVTDLAEAPRFYDDPNTVDTGQGSAPVVDMGAYEYHLIYPICGDSDHPFVIGDLNTDCIVSFTDLAILSQNWLVCTKPECD